MLKRALGAILGLWASIAVAQAPLPGYGDFNATSFNYIASIVALEIPLAPQIIANCTIGGTGCLNAVFGSQFASGVVAAFQLPLNNTGGLLGYGGPSTGLNYTASGAGAGTVTQQAINARTVNIDDYQAAGDGVTDDTSHLSAAATALGSTGGFVNLSCAKNYYIGTNYTIPANVTIRHCRGAGWFGNPGIDWSSSPLASQPHINLSSSATLTFSSNSGFEGVVLNSTITFPVQTPAAYAGTALGFPGGGANDVHINALVVGFAECLDHTNGGDRPNFHIECDGNPTATTTTGQVVLGPTADTAIIQIRTYPWGTVGYPTSPQLTRTGTGITLLSNISDDAQLDLFNFGAATGIYGAENGNIHIHRIWADNNSGYGVNMPLGNGHSSVDAAWLYTNTGLRYTAANGDLHFGYLYINTGVVANADCLEISGTAILYVDHLAIDKCSFWAANIGTAGTAKLIVGNYAIRGVAGSGGAGTGPYVIGATGWDATQFQHGPGITDLNVGQPLVNIGSVGAIQQTLPSVASAATLAPPADYDHILVTGTTAITNMSGCWEDRRIILTFSGALTFTNGGDLVLTGGANFSTAAGSSIGLWCDASSATAVWREMWRH